MLVKCGITDFPPPRLGTTLTLLWLDNNPLGVSGIQSLETAVLAGALVNLMELTLSNTFTNDADINGALLTTLLPSIASHCPFLAHFDLSKNNFSVPGACALGEAICLLGITNKLPSYIFVDDININQDAMVSFCAHALTPIKEWLEPIFVWLGNNLLGLDGLLSMLRILRSSTCKIASLSLRNTALDLHDQRSINILSFCPDVSHGVLTHLQLSDNNFSGDSIVILVECIRVCQSLEALRCCNCSLTSTDIIILLSKLKLSINNHKHLKGLDLFNNLIDNKGATELIENSQLISEVFPNLRILNVGVPPPMNSKSNICWEVSSQSLHFNSNNIP